MILTCPSCGTRYQTDSSKFTSPGRNVRCAKCGEVWFQTYPEAEIEPEPEPVIAPLADARYREHRVRAGRHAGVSGSAMIPSATSAQAKHPPRRPRSAGEAVTWRLKWNLAQLGGWAALIAMVAAIGWATINFRDTIASLWPQSASLYAVLGVPVNVRGLTLTGVSYKQDVEDGQPVLSVTGKINNVTDREMSVPEMRVVLYDDAQKHELYHWTFDVGVPTLKPGAARRPSRRAWPARRRKPAISTSVSRRRRRRAVSRRKGRGR